MIKIRLARGGKKKAPIYRIVAIQSTRKREGKPLQTLGFWDPKNDVIQIDKQKVKDWISKGAQMTPSVRKLIK